MPKGKSRKSRKLNNSAREARLRIDILAEGAAQEATKGMKMGPQRSRIWDDVYDTVQRRLQERRIKAIKKLRTIRKKRGGIAKGPRIIFNRPGHMLGYD